MNDPVAKIRRDICCDTACDPAFNRSELQRIRDRALSVAKSSSDQSLARAYLNLSDAVGHVLFSDTSLKEGL